MEMKVASQSQSRNEITQEFKDLKSFLESCDCGEEEEDILRKQKITLKRLPNFKEQDFVRYGMSEGAARELDQCVKKYRLNHHDSNENQVCVDCVGCVDFESGKAGNQLIFIFSSTSQPILSQSQLPSQTIPQPSSSPIPSPSHSASDITQDFKDLKSFLESCDSEECLSIFLDNGIKLKHLPQWTFEGLRDKLGLKIGPANVIAEALKPYQPHSHS